MTSNGFTASPDDDSSAAADAKDLAAEASLRLELATLAGLDSARGLRNFRGRIGSYARLLQKFAATRASDIERIGMQLAARDYSELSSLTHNIKGVAGFLGAVRIEELAGEASAAARLPRDDEQIEQLATALIGAQSELSTRLLAVLGPWAEEGE